MSLCECGCGEDAGVYGAKKHSNGKSYATKKTGKPRRFLTGHSGHRSPPLHIGEKIGNRIVVASRRSRSGKSTEVRMKCRCGDVSGWLVGARRTKLCGKCSAIQNGDALCTKVHIGEVLGGRRVVAIKRFGGHVCVKMKCPCGSVSKWMYISFAKKNRECQQCGARKSGLTKQLKISTGDRFGSREVLEVKMVRNGNAHNKKQKCLMRCVCGDIRWSDATTLTRRTCVRCPCCASTRSRALILNPNLSEPQLEELLYNAAVLRYLEPNKRPCGQPIIKEKK